ncbi:MAG: nitrogen regulation protein NR(I), partial [Candidatus Dadabacteria bacterium]|nr:nitrogen regulation protein NR(I) [Candidatus Dadabacteria bacterium]
AIIESAPGLIKNRAGDNDFDSVIANQVSELVGSLGEDLPIGIYENVVSRIEKPLIEEILKVTKGNKKKAAEVLGINRNTLSKKMSDLHIKYED